MPSKPRAASTPTPLASTAASSATSEVTATTLALVMEAVRLARDEGVRTVAQLRIRMSQRNPSALPEDIDAALRLWGRREKALQGARAALAS